MFGSETKGVSHEVRTGSCKLNTRNNGVKDYYVIWTYITNYGVIQQYPGKSPEDVARKVVAGFSEDFALRGKVYVFENPPAFRHDRSVSAEVRWPAPERRRVSRLLIVALGVLIAAGEFIHDPVLALAYWSGTLLLVLWIVLLAILDMAASHQRRRSDPAAAISQRIRPQNQRAQRDNGHPPGGEAGNGEPENRT